MLCYEEWICCVDRRDEKEYCSKSIYSRETGKQRTVDFVFSDWEVVVGESGKGEMGLEGVRADRCGLAEAVAWVEGFFGEEFMVYEEVF